MLIDKENIEISICHKAELWGSPDRVFITSRDFYPTPTLTQVHIYDTLPNYYSCESKIFRDEICGE